MWERLVSQVARALLHRREWTVKPFGVMFAPNQALAARELLRVVRRGGVIGLANWTPEGFIGRLLVTIAKYVPPPVGVASPIYWGNEARLRELFPDVSALRIRRREFVFRYESAEHFLYVFRRYYGPVLKAFSVLDSERQAALAEDICDLVARFSHGSKSKAVAIPAEYLEVVIDR
jgi:hypothetical protein